MIRVISVEKHRPVAEMVTFVVHECCHVSHKWSSEKINSNVGNFEVMKLGVAKLGVAKHVQHEQPVRPNIQRKQYHSDGKNIIDM